MFFFSMLVLFESWQGGNNPAPILKGTYIMTTLSIQLDTTLSFNIGGEQLPVNVADLSPEALTGLLMYGMRKANDTYNGQKNSDNAMTPEEVIEKIKVWDFGKGGSRVSPLVKAQRDIVITHLRSIGMKANEANKAAKNPQDGFKVYLRSALAKKLALPEIQVDQESVDKAFEANWARVETKAQEILAMESIDLDL